jgi:hybrid cluster-associated redox disulfide protein
MPIAPDMLVDDVMQRWPATIRVFLDTRMRCVGCPVACFHTVDDAAREHGIDREALLRALRLAADSQRPLPPLAGEGGGGVGG